MTGFVVHSARAVSGVYLAAKGTDPTCADNSVAWTRGGDVADAELFLTREKANAWAMARFRSRWSWGLSEEEVLSQDSYVVLSLEELAALILATR